MPSAQLPTPGGATQGFQPQTVTWQQLDWRWGTCAAPSSTKISRVAHTSEELKELLRLQTQANSNAGLNQTWGVMACRQGEWIFRHGHYAMVLSAKTHPVCKGAECKRIHPPAYWVKAGGKIGFVPAHPKDIKGKPPINLKNGIFVPGTAAGKPFQHVNLEASQKVKVLSKAPAEFQHASTPNLTGVPAPKIQAHLLDEKTGAKTLTAANRGNSQITYDYKSRQFLRSERSAGGAQSKGVPVGGLGARGGGLGNAGGRSGGYGGSSNSGGGGGRSSGSYSSGGSSSGGSSSRSSSGGGGWSGGSSASSGSSGGSSSSGGGSRGGGGRP